MSSWYQGGTVAISSSGSNSRAPGSRVQAQRDGQRGRRNPSTANTRPASNQDAALRACSCWVKASTIPPSWHQAMPRAADAAARVAPSSCRPSRCSHQRTSGAPTGITSRNSADSRMSYSQGMVRALGA